MRDEATALKRFLRKELYYHYRVQRMATKAKRIVVELFAAFDADPNLLPPEHAGRHATLGARAIADYVAGMTDRYAIREHRRAVRDRRVARLIADLSRVGQKNGTPRRPVFYRQF